MNQRIFGRVFARILVTVTSLWVVFTANAQTSSPLTAIAQVATGFSHSCAVSNSGGVFCWGDNASQQLGRSTPAQSLVATNVPGLATGVQMVALGAEHTCALTTAGGVKCWGGNNYGQTGTGSAAAVIATPSDAVGLTSGVIFIASGAWHTCALTSTNGVLCWGRNEDGQTGSGSISTKIATPTQVNGLTSGVAMISSGGFYTCAQMMGGAVNCWGDNYWGYFGNGTTSDSSTPTPSPALQGVLSNNVLQPMSAGYFNNCVITTAGGVKCFGDNSYGQLGVTNVTSSANPLDVPAWSSGVTRIATAANFACALTATGVQCLGDNSNGQLGNGSIGAAFNSTPSPVTNITEGVSQLSATLSHACVVTATGGVKCWGANAAGQLGNNATTPSGLPVVVLSSEPTPLNLPLVFSETFDGPALDVARWNAAVQDARGHPAAVTFANGKMTATVPGGSNGYMGIADGSTYTPIGISLTGDFEIALIGEELLREQINGNRDNSGVRITAGSVSIDISGNYSGYWNALPYATYNKHRIVAYNGSTTCFLDESLSLTTLYPFELRIRRVGGAVTVLSRYGTGAWAEATCGSLSGNVSPQIIVNSGDGGNTVTNGRMAAALDSFVVRGTAVVNGTCGTANGVATSTAPTANLCATGTASAVVTNASNYTWTCSGVNGGATSSCSAPKDVASAVALSLARDNTKTESVAHGDGHMGGRMDDGVSSGQELRMSDTLRITCSAASCPWTALVTPAPVAWLRIANGSGTATSSTPSSLVFFVDSFEETVSARVGYIEVDDGTGTKKTWKVTQNPLTDWDEDGVADEWEQRGYPKNDGTRLALAGNYLKPSTGCRPDETSPQSNLCKRSAAPFGNIVASESASVEQRKAARDIWLWLDRMSGVGTDQEARSSVVPRVAQAFQRNNIAVRWLSSFSDFSASLPESTPDLDSAAQIAALRQTNFVRILGSSSRAYRYVVWGNKFSQSGAVQAASGYAPETRDIIFIAAGAGTTNGLDSEGLQTGTLMHELGHNLGLGHGGPWFNGDRSDLVLPDYDTRNYHKPNHISVMSYTYQFNGLVVSDPSLAYDYDSNSWDTVDEGALSNFWTKPLSVGGVKTNTYGILQRCDREAGFLGFTSAVEGVFPAGVTASCLTNVYPFGLVSTQPSSTKLDYDYGGVPVFANNKRHVSRSEWDRLQFVYAAGMLDVAGAAASPATYSVKPSAEELSIDQLKRPSQYNHKLLLRNQIRNRLAPQGSFLSFYLSLENTGFNEDSYEIAVRPTTDVTQFGWTYSTPTPLVTLPGGATTYIRIDIVVAANGEVGATKAFQVSATSRSAVRRVETNDIAVTPTASESSPFVPLNDITANDFALTGITNVKPDIYVESGSVVLTGFDVPLPIQVRGGEMSINGGGWTHYISTINPGDTLRLRTVSSTVAGEKRTVEVAVGGLVRAFEVTTSLDTDNDGIPDAVEAAGPNNGDANGDGIPDKDQKNVGTIFSPAGNGYVTFEVSGGCSVAEAITAYTESQMAMQDPSWAYPLGLISFRLPCSAATVKLYYHGVPSLNGYTMRRFGPTTPGNSATTSWSTVPSVTYGTTNIGGNAVATASYALRDGQPGDDSGTDGSIIDPVGPALYVGGPVDANGNPIPVPTNDRSGLIMLAMMLCIAGGLSYRRHRRRLH